MSALIRLARPEDVAAAGRVTRQAYLAAGFVTDTDPYADLLSDAARRAAHAELWVCVEEGHVAGPAARDRLGAGRVVGTVTFVRPGTPYAEVSAADEGEFRMLAVDPAAHGRGLGELLVRHCQQRAGELGLSALVLSTLPQMRAAHRIYERLGFTRTPERDWRPRPEMLLITYRWQVGT